MEKLRVFVSYDTDNDYDLLQLLAAQAGESESHFEIVDWSGNKATSQGADLLERLAQVDSVIVICGELTHASKSVSEVVSAAQQIGKPYLLLWGRKGRLVSTPSSALPSDHLHEWTWVTLEQQLKTV
jgi:hypothetical protein